MLVSDLVATAKQNLAQLATACKRAFRRIAEIESGPGKGLRFDAGRGSKNFASGKYERPVQEALACLVKPGAACYDVGANLGFFSILLSRLAGPTGSIYAFEPVPDNAAMIERNARLNQLENIAVLRLALSCIDGRGELMLAQHVGGAVLKTAGTPPDLVGSMMVETASLDTLVERQQIRPPNVVKIDVEGAEMEVLKGMVRVLRRCAPTIVLELDDETVEECEKKVSLCRSFLHEFGYRTELLENSYPDGPWFVRHFVARRV